MGQLDKKSMLCPGCRRLISSDEPTCPFCGLANPGSPIRKGLSRLSLRDPDSTALLDGDVIELHDCFSSNEMITYEALGLCAPGKGGELIDSGAVTYGGRWVVNPSGGLISKGHPLGATGLAQCSELNWQLRGQSEKRQVKGAKVALQHNIGLGGAAVVTMYRKADFGT